MSSLVARIRRTGTPTQTAAICFPEGGAPRTFEKKRGWYEVTEVEAEVLRKERAWETSAPGAEPGPLVFEIVTKEQAAGMDAAERRAKNSREADDPVQAEHAAATPSDKPVARRRSGRPPAPAARARGAAPPAGGAAR